MDSDGEADALVRGLRAFTILVDHAPLDVDRFARLNDVSIERARALMQTYESCGYARRMEHREIYVLTPLAMDLMGLGRGEGRLH